MVGNVGDIMRRVIWGPAPKVFQLAVFRLAGPVAIVVATSLGAAMAQSGAQEQSKQQPAASQSDSTKNTQREFTEAAQTINGPAGNPECVWLGRNAVQMMLRDDLDTAFRHLDLYDRFGCPGGHVQATFRCVARFGIPDVKATEATKSLVHSCWVNPAAQPPQAQSTTAAAPAPAANGASPPAANPPAQGQAQPANK